MALQGNGWKNEQKCFLHKKKKLKLISGRQEGNSAVVCCWFNCPRGCCGDVWDDSGASPRSKAVSLEGFLFTEDKMEIVMMETKLIRAGISEGMAE